MVCAIVLLFILVNKYFREKVQSYFYAILFWTLYMFSVTEILSVFHQVKTFSFWCAWGMLDVILLIICLKKRVFAYKKITRTIKNKAMLYFSALFALSVIFLAVKTVPYNWDSMTYHLSRVVHWSQNHSVAHYASNVERQIASPVLGAFINLNIYSMMDGYDRMLNLVQCFSYFTNGLFVYYIAHKLGSSTRYCILAGMLFLTLPIAFGEALTTQIDNLSAMYALGLVYLLLDFCHIEKKLVYDKESIIKVIMMGFGVAFAYLAKPSVGIGILILAIWLLIISLLRRDSIVITLKLILTAIPGMLVIMIPEIWRNILTFHSVSASSVSTGQMIDSLNKRYMVINFLKNFTSNIPSVWLYKSSDLVWNWMIKLAMWMNIDINDPAISNSGADFIVRDVQTYQHDSAINPIIMWILIITAIMLLLMIHRINLRRLKSIKTGYYLASVISFLVFCLLLKWSPWRNRYMIFYFALLCPAAVCVIEWFMRMLKKEKIENGFVAIVWFCMFVEVLGMFVYHTKIASEKGTYDRYFLVRSEEYMPYQETADYLNSRETGSVGLLVNEDTYEYPLWRMLNADRIEHVGVKNETKVYEDITFVPDVVLTINKRIEEDIWECHNNKYKLIKQCADNIQIFEKIEVVE